VNRVVPAGELAKAAKELAEKIAGFSASVNRAGEARLLPAAADAAPDGLCAHPGSDVARTRPRRMRRKGMKAFLAKRPPKWK